MSTSGKFAVVVERKRSDSKTPIDDKDKESAAYLKRREQVRRAQRTHRERKENYIKALEDELFQLRARERKFTEENRALNAEVAQLRDLVSFDDSQTWGQSDWTGLEGPIPNTVGDCSKVESVGSNYEPISTGDDWQLLFQDVTECSASTTSMDSYLEPAMSTTSPNVELCVVPSWRTSSMNVSQVNRTDLAVEFVMTLEKPCLNRATSAIIDIGQPNTDQALSVTRGTIYHSFLEDSFLISPEATKVDANSRLDKLLSLSSKFDLIDQLTPIQAWTQIVSHPGFGSLGLRVLTRLVEDMLEYIRCYGFGAVIEKTAFDTLCRKLFATNC